MSARVIAAKDRILSLLTAQNESHETARRSVRILEREIRRLRVDRLALVAWAFLSSGIIGYLLWALSEAAS